MNDSVSGSNGRGSNGRDANGSDANGRDANGSDANGSDANGSDAEGEIYGAQDRSRVLSVNLARVQPNPFKPGVELTGIEKLSTPDPVLVRAPGPKAGGLGGGLVGDSVGDRKNHGGDTQAVYAYAREDLDYWESVLGRPLPGGAFGENLTTAGLDVNGAVIGERWRIGDELELAVTVPRVPCGTFRGWIAERGWLRTFSRAAMPGAYLAVVTPGLVRAGDRVIVVHRPAHGVTIAQVFRALTLEPELLPSILAADELEEETRAMARDGRTFALGSPQEITD